MRTAPEHDRAALSADAVSLRDCAARLDALASDLPADRLPRGADALAVLAKRCRTAADDLDAAAAAFDRAPDRPQAEAARAGQ